MRKMLLVTTACIFCAPFAIASAQEGSGEAAVSADQDTMAADLNAQQLAQFRAGEGYEGEGDIETDAGAAIEESGAPLETGAEADTGVDPGADVDVDDPDASYVGEGDVDVEGSADETGDALEEGADQVEESAQDRADRLRDSADEAADDLSPAAEEAVEDTADDAADAIEENADAVEDATRETADDIEDSADDLKQEDITEDPLIRDEDDMDVSTPPYDQPNEADAVKDPTDPN